jgi:hypothetical protein
MEIILAVIVGGLVAYIGYFLGFKIGLAMRGGNNTAKPFPKPTKVEKVSKEEKEAAEAEKRKLDTIMENIENYDGTGFGQKDV